MWKEIINTDILDQLMKFKVLQEELSKALSIAVRFTNVRAQLPVLANVLISAQKNKLIVSATNLENSISIPIGAKVDTQGEITVPSKAFSDIVSNLASGTVSFLVDKEKLKISSANFNSTLAGMNAADFPVVPQVVGKSTFKLAVKNILEALSLVLFSASVDETRPVLTGVLLLIKPNSLQLVATDGFRLSQIKLKIFYKGKALKVILPKNVLSELIRLSSDDQDIKFEYKVKESQVVFATDGAVLASRTIEGEFPDYNKIIPKTAKITLNLDREELLRAVKLASVFARDSANVVKMRVKKDSVEIFAESSSAGNQTTSIDAKVDTELAKSAKSKDLLEIAFNYRFLEDLLNALKCEDLHINLTDSNSPAVFTDPGDKDFLHLIMPVRLQS